MHSLRTAIACAASLFLWQAAVPAASAAGPSIAAVVNAANYQPVIASATFVAIIGTNLSTTTRGWAGNDFVGNALPVMLDGVSVTVNGKAAYVNFISPAQINLLCPDDPATGQVAVQVTNGQGTSSAFAVSKQALSPGVFAYSPDAGRYAVVQAGVNYSLVAPPGLIGPTVRTTPAAPGEVLILYATGLGPVTPAQPTGQLVQASAPTTGKVTVSMGGQSATVQFAGLIESGLYQINVVVPSILSGDAKVVVAVNGTSASVSPYVPIQAPPGPVGGLTTPVLVGCLTGSVDYIVYSVSRLSFDLADQMSIGGTQMCSTCTVKPPLYADFMPRLERSMERKETVQACYDATGNVYQLKIVRP